MSGQGRRSRTGSTPAGRHLNIEWQTVTASLAARRQAASVAGIADQRLAWPEQQQQHDTYDTHDRPDRLVQDDPDHTIPQPGRNPVHHGVEGSLAGLVDVVPEFAQPGQAQGLVAATSATATATANFTPIDLSANANNRYTFRVNDGTNSVNISLDPSMGTSGVISL
eukprot:gene4782-6516_t